MCIGGLYSKDEGRVRKFRLVLVGCYATMVAAILLTGAMAV